MKNKRRGESKALGLYAISYTRSSFPIWEALCAECAATYQQNGVSVVLLNERLTKYPECLSCGAANVSE